MDSGSNDGTAKDAKGKGKATTDECLGEPNHKTAGDQGDGGMLSRIAKSAAELPSALLNTGGLESSELSRLATTEKGGTSRSGESAFRQAETPTQFDASLSASSTFKPRQTEEHVAQEEALFSAFLDSTDIQQPSDSVEHRTWEPALPSQTPVSQPDPRFRSVAEQEARDGSEVLALLSGDIETGVDYPVDEAISESDMTALRRAFLGTGTGEHAATIAWDNALNFIPEDLREGRHLGSVLGQNEMPESITPWQSWVEQWSRVLTSYQDEVWGDLGALVSEAREEIRQLEQIRPDEKPPKPTALLRLRAILGHLRGTAQ